MSNSKVNPKDPEACDYSWAAKANHVIRAGQLPDSQDVCYIEDTEDCEVQLFTPSEAILLATDLLAWAMFIQEGHDGRSDDDAALEEFDRPLNEAGEYASTCTRCAEHGRLNCGTCN